jgi:hypothetical protein
MKVVFFFRCLEQIRSAFDPLTAQRPTKPPSTNGLDLARMNQRLTENIRYRLLPHDTVIQMEAGPVWEDSLTLAESYAHQVSCLSAVRISLHFEQLYI